MDPQTKPKMSWKKKLGYGILGFFILQIFIITSFEADTRAKKREAEQPQQQVIQEDTKSQEQAGKELKEIMDMGMKAHLVSSYEFSESANVVYVDYVWYSQNVTFKKDFLAKVAMLKKSATGYRHFEVRDAKSNEKVAEVTAFSGSLEVYK